MIIDQYDPLKGQMLQILDKDGNLSPKVKPLLSDDETLKLYRVIMLCRVMDQKAIAMQRQGRIVTYVPTSGQEAAVVGAVYALRKEDWLVPAFREMPGQVLRGAKLSDILLWERGNEAGFKAMVSLRITPVSVPVASHIPHATGIGWAAKLRKEPVVALAIFGDGATSEGDFHEGLNFAGMFKTNTVFLCQNNQWAISVPRKQQTASPTLAQKAVAYGFTGVQVDGNDLFAVHLAAKEAVEKARSGGGPTLIEAYTYRLGPHTTADDPRKYRKEEEVEYWKDRDPITRLRTYLMKKKLWNDQKEKALIAECEQTVEEAVQVMEKATYDEDSVFKYHYAEMTEELKEQSEEFKRWQSL